MNFVIKYIHSVWLAVLLGIVTTSCTQDSVNFVSADEARMLSIGFNVPTSRTINETEPGNYYENYIDWSDYRIYFFDYTANTYIATFKPNSIESRSGSDNTLYEAVGEIPEALIENGQLKDFKIVVLANWPASAYPNDDDLTVGETGFDAICDAPTAIFNCLTDFELNENNLIPFYGVQEYTNEMLSSTPGNPATFQLVPNVELMRAMAKVEVIFDPNIPEDSNDQWSDLTLSEVKIHRYNSKGYCAPSGVYDSSNYPDNQDDDKHILHLVGGKNDSNDSDDEILPFHLESENKRVAYLPEYSNQGQDDYSYITLKFNHQLAGDESYKIYFAQYQEGGNTPSKSDIDLIRNNIYRFTVQKDGFRLFLTVSDWAGLYENVFDFGDGQVVSPVAPWEDKINNEVEIEVN